MKKPKLLLKQGYYHECEPFFDKLSDEIEVIESRVEIFPKTMTHREILETYKIEPYTLEQATGILLGILDDLKYPSRLIYFKDNDVLYCFNAYRRDGGGLRAFVYETLLDSRCYAGYGVCLSNKPLNTQSSDTSTLSSSDYCDCPRCINCKKLIK